MASLVRLIPMTLFRSKPVPSRLVPRELEFAPPAHRAILEELPPSPLHLQEVALHLRAMTYGEMIIFAKAIGANPDTVWEWANQP